MASFTSKVSGNWNAAGQTTWNEVGTPGAGDDVTIQNTHVVTQVQNEACAGIVVDAGGELDNATFNLVNSSTSVFSGKHTMGVSADTGLTTVGLTYNAGSERNLNTLSKINSSGAYDCDNSALSTNSNRGILKFTVSANIATPHADNTWYDIQSDVGVDLTMTDDCYLTTQFSRNNLFNGSINVNGNTLYIGASAAGSFENGVGCVISGAGIINTSFLDGCTFTLATTTHTFTGTYQTFGIDDSVLPALNMRNATVKWTTGGLNTTMYTSAGTLECGSLLTAYFSAGHTIDNSKYNPDFVIYGIWSIQAPTTSGYTNGTGTIFLKGNNASISTSTNNMEDVVNEATAGQTKTLTSVLRCESYTNTSGILAGNSKNMVITDGNFAVNGGTVSGIKDLRFSGSGAQSIKSNAGTPSTNVQIQKTGGTLTQVDKITCTNFDHTNGGYDPNGKDVQTTGNYNISGANTTVVAAGLLGTTVTVGSLYTVTGTAANIININPAGVWTLIVSGSSNVTYANVKNSDASGGATIEANIDNAVDQGGNLNWDFHIAGMEIIANTGLIIGLSFT
jgi:hypothetical protein